MNTTPEDREKELIYKLQVLKMALLNEKKKTELLETENKNLKKINIQLEKQVETKDEEIVKINLEKQRLISQIDFHRHKSFQVTGVMEQFNHNSYAVDYNELADEIINKTGEEEEYLHSEEEIEAQSKNKKKKSMTNPDNDFNVYLDEKEKEEKENVNKIVEANSNTTATSNIPIFNDKKEEEANENCEKSGFQSTIYNIQTKVGSIFGKMFTSSTNQNQSEIKQIISEKKNSMKTPINLKLSTKILEDCINNTHNHDCGTPTSNNSMAYRLNTESYNQIKTFSLNQEDAKSNYSGLDNKSLSFVKKEKGNYELIIHQLKSENQNLKNLLLEANKNTGKVKDEFHTLIKNQVDKIKQLQLEVNESRDELMKYSKSTEAVMNQNKQYEVKLINYENSFKQLQVEISALKDSMKKGQSIIEDKITENCMLKEKSTKQEKENSILAKKLAELKNAILTENTSQKKVFTGRKKELFTSSAFTMTFTKTEDSYYVIIFKDDTGKIIEYINLEDVENINKIENEENSLELVYMKNKKSVTWNLLMNENVHEVIKSYKEFLDWSMKLKNNLYY